MAKFIYGRSGHGVLKQMGLDIKGRISKDKLHIKPEKVKEILGMAEKVFKQNNRDPYKIEQRKFVEEVSNRYGLGSAYKAGNVKKIEEALGITEHSGRIGTKYRSVMEREREKFKKEMQTSGVVQKTSKSDVKASGAVQPPVKTGRKFTTVEEVQKFRADLTKKIAARKAQSAVQGPQDKEENGEVKTARYQTETTQGTGGQNGGSDKNSTELKSGGKKKAEKPGVKGKAIGTGGQKTGGMALTSRSLPKGMARPARAMEISDEELSKFRGLGLGRGLNPSVAKGPDIAGGADDLAEDNDWRFAAYSEEAKDTAASKPDLKESKQLGGQENDSFGMDDWKNN